jgi:hypothetical protein
MQAHSGQSPAGESGQLPSAWGCSKRLRRPQPGQCRVISVIGNLLATGLRMMLARRLAAAGDLRRRVAAMIN